MVSYHPSSSNHANPPVINSTISGGVCVNGVLVHMMVPNAPFGGVGDSGHGAYHGDYGFKSFTHYRTIAHPRPLFFKATNFLRPPYSLDKIKKLGVRNSAGIQRNWSLEKERAATKRGLVIAKSFRIIKFLAYFVVLLGLADVGLDRRLGIFKGVRDLFVQAKSFF